MAGKDVSRLLGPGALMGQGEENLKEVIFDELVFSWQTGERYTLLIVRGAEVRSC